MNNCLEHEAAAAGQYGPLLCHPSAVKQQQAMDYLPNVTVMLAMVQVGPQNASSQQVAG